ncbi:Hsp20/alpha crystallin family protein [Candidatus Uhrbacteria bacterium]|nr:Hsp20/alpha crystallin family protein [Candidatus Uhrbacteria bacterium]
MSLIRWEPFRELDRLFDEDWSTMPLSKIGTDLAVDLYEEGDKVVAKMQLPGVDPKKIDVSVEDQYLKVFGAREEEKEEKKKDYYSKEIRRGSFERLVRLPKPVVADKVSADYKDGVLIVTMPKQAGSNGGKVKVNIAS